VLETRRSLDLDAEMAKIERSGVRLITWQDAEYPSLLREAASAPPVLYLRGEITPADRASVAVVGTRRPSPYGQSVARDLGAALALHGVTLVSGMARGIDALAHRAALEAGGRTLAVLGSGLDEIYPSEHRLLAEEIAAHGALVSDYALGTKPEAANFPPRNRIISGLARAVVIVEAGEESGALITARFAAEQGRDVFVVPGSIYNRTSKGTNRLLQEGAAPLLTPDDVLETLRPAGDSRVAAGPEIELDDPLERALMDLLSSEPVHVDDLVVRAGLPVPQVTAALSLLELRGLVHHVGAMHYVRSGASRALEGTP
jgi:DNA processing protein